MGRNPQQPEARRSDRGANTQDSAQAKAGTDRAVGPGGSRRAHGTDRGAKGGQAAKEQRPDHP